MIVEFMWKYRKCYIGAFSQAQGSLIQDEGNELLFSATLRPHGQPAQPILLEKIAHCPLTVTELL